MQIQDYQSGALRIIPFSMIFTMKRLNRSHTVSFDVAVPPKLLPFSFGEEPLNSGQVVTVPCAVIEGDAPLKLRWTLNGHGISPHSGIAILDLGGRGAILSIGSVKASHAGSYNCIAENLAGRHELSADLIVNGAHLHDIPHFLCLISKTCVTVPAIFHFFVHLFWRCYFSAVSCVSFVYFVVRFA